MSDHRQNFLCEYDLDLRFCNHFGIDHRRVYEAIHSFLNNRGWKKLQYSVWLCYNKRRNSVLNEIDFLVAYIEQSFTGLQPPTILSPGIFKRLHTQVFVQPNVHRSRP
ncbi:MAG: hypothetical protein Sylvanvirus3_21 [Sylvanvirus sp.]|uniref:Uncharacterized protein n=1 Tax=Sylvanvirus sp. TaxID=2487774 RepID=A0A3G5AH94_9VIRU|nr:MAG: hypothetical protein Sylvanvirus3_21 [Sylvanvirus sp.]